MHASRRIFAALLATAPMLVIGAAGVLKMIDVPRFEKELLAWAVIPDSIAGGVALVVPTLEVGLAAMWAFSLCTRAVFAVAAAMLVLFSAALAAEWSVAGPPTCACLGLLGEYLDRMNEAKFSLARNGVMIAMLVTSLAMTRDTSGGGHSAEDILQPDAGGGVHLG